MDTESQFYKAITSKDLLTENGMPTHSTSGMKLVDMFFKMGGSRGLSDENLIQMFVNAFGESRLHALKLMFHNRDIRGGQGERRSFRIFWRFLCCTYPEIAIKNIQNVPFYGRWDDLLVGLNSPIEREIADYIFFALKSGDQLCGKWMPRENKKQSNYAKRLMYLWGINAKKYRNLLVGNTKVVENLMCKNQWGKIEYEKVPSIAVKNYRNAFRKHDEARYLQWLEKVEKGESKINASSIFLHDILSPIVTKIYNLVSWSWKDSSKFASKFSPEELKQLELQWRAVPDYVPSNLNFLVVSDVSGSMYMADNALPIKACLALGIYLSERNKGKFKDLLMTFSRIPELFHLTGKTVFEKLCQMLSMNWDQNTDIEAVFRTILDKAKDWNLPQEEMPDYIVILSDMQFDQCVYNYSDTFYEMVTRMYSKAGYKLPQIIFWNLRTGFGVPVKFDQKGTALISGFSPSIMMSLMAGELNPLFIMFNTINKERYNRVTL